MKALILLSIMALLLLAGCSSPTVYWYHPDRTLDEAAADYSQCQEEASRKAADMISGHHYDRLPPPEGAPGLNDSLQERGRSKYNPDETQDAWRERYEQSIISNSMKEKGYLKLSQDHVPPGVHTRHFDEGAVAGR
jgi:hypothetical protein